MNVAQQDIVLGYTRPRNGDREEDEDVNTYVGPSESRTNLTLYYARSSTRIKLHFAKSDSGALHRLWHDAATEPE